ncbi:MAG: portal protein [Reyranella sp.]|nr:portal protein [Reyranella sp.]
MGCRPAYQINPPLDQMSAAIERRQQAVRAAFHADLFLMATQLDEVRSATEIPPPPSPALDGLRLQPEYVWPMAAMQSTA